MTARYTAIAAGIASSTLTPHLSRRCLGRSLFEYTRLQDSRVHLCRLSRVPFLYQASYRSLHTNATMAIDDLTAPQAAVPQPIDIEAWTEQATAAMGSVTISAPAAIAQETSVGFDIPLDEHDAPARPAPTSTSQVHTVYRRKEPVRRDSLKRREALLKGKEGSRRRQRWENGTS